MTIKEKKEELVKNGYNEIDYSRYNKFIYYKDKNKLLVIEYRFVYFVKRDTIVNVEFQYVIKDKKWKTFQMKLRGETIEGVEEIAKAFVEFIDKYDIC